MTVYVLTTNYINVDSGDYNHEVIGVYENIDDANKDMKQAIMSMEICLGRSGIKNMK